ncbi:TadE/TadG family type IV pilus assembly protein [Massilia arenae]|uniref:Pilus assembly protein n=1 Tax=Massilia arenae TaxID=2603288 RepID=A0A5C7FZF7_9BURK|nr:TadE/TadG family type IV pilus assembly protein [Massilia arenae]TXF96019.1 pilus assembly protein [Massilia arenae]
MYSTPRRQSGATLVEMAIIAPVFLLVLVAIIELSMMFFATLTMQYAVREGARFAITGRSSESATGNQQRYANVIAKIKDNSLGMYERTDPQISVNGTRYSTTSFSNGMFGAPGDIVVIQLDCGWPVTTPLLSSFFTKGVYQFTVAATMRNEIFP